MQIETSPEFGYCFYTLSEPEVSALVSSLGLEPGEFSPLAVTVPQAGAESLPEGAGPLAPAMAILASPDLVVSARTWPAGGGLIRFYGAAGKPDLVMMAASREAGEYRLIWPIGRAVFVNLMTGPLMSGFAGSESQVSFELSLDDLFALAGLVDLQRETMLTRAIGRDASGEVRFAAEDIPASCRKGLDSGDPRWMAGRLAFALGAGQAGGAGDASRLIGELCGAGLLERDGEGYRILPAGGQLFDQLADIRGFASVVANRREAGGSDAGWLEHALLLQSNGAQIWCYDFAGAGPSGPQVELSAVSREVMVGKLAGLLAEARLVPGDSGEAAPGGRTCGSCGAPLRPGVKFCPKCGAGTDSATASETAAPVRCPRCGSACDWADRYCQDCGAELPGPAGGPGPAPAARAQAAQASVPGLAPAAGGGSAGSPDRRAGRLLKAQLARLVFLAGAWLGGFLIGTGAAVAVDEAGAEYGLMVSVAILACALGAAGMARLLSAGVSRITGDPEYLFRKAAYLLIVPVAFALWLVAVIALRSEPDEPFFSISLVLAGLATVGVLQAVDPAGRAKAR